MKTIYQLLTERINDGRLEWTNFEKLVAKSLSNTQMDLDDPDFGTDKISKGSKTGNNLTYSSNIGFQGSIILDLSQILTPQTAQGSKILFSGKGILDIAETLKVGNGNRNISISYGGIGEGGIEIYPDAKGLPDRVESRMIRYSNNTTLAHAVNYMVGLWNGPAISAL